jgi:hypothetical protein
MNSKLLFVISFGLCLSQSAQSSGASPTPPARSLYLHLDAAKVSAQNGQAVTTWTDLIGNQPLTGTATYVAEYTPGQPGLRFNGTSDSLGTKRLLGGPEAGNLTLFIVGNFATSGNDETSDVLVSAQHPHNADNRLRILKGKDDGKLDVAVGGGSTMSNVWSADTAVHIFGLVAGQSTGKVDFMIDGNVIKSGSHGDYEALQALFFGSYRGSSQFFEGTIAEVLLYNRALGKSEVEAVTKYLLSRYSIKP